MEQRLLLVEDDLVFARVVSRALGQRGYEVAHAESLAMARELIVSNSFHYAILDLNLGGQTSLELIPLLTEKNPDIRTLILTGYASIATAVEAIKLGATNYLAKPADTEEILAALLEKTTRTSSVDAAQEPMSVRRLEWEHIQKVLKENDGNISETARQLKMHRRTLQRKLQKKPVAK
ncbi:MAG: response regulator transcription factor [Gammaproteobacteria bacterium]|nr:response regulator transcription factor [Gammaproteobacteria bacterium]